MASHGVAWDPIGLNAACAGPWGRINTPWSPIGFRGIGYAPHAWDPTES